MPTRFHFSLNYAAGSREQVRRLLALEPGDRVLWIGVGDGRDCHHVAERHPRVSFVGIEANPTMGPVVLQLSPLDNLTFEIVDLDAYAAREGAPRFTHVYAGAFADVAFYAAVWEMAGRCGARHLVAVDKVLTHALTVRQLAAYPRVRVRYAGGRCTRTLWKVTSTKLAQLAAARREAALLALPVGCALVERAPVAAAGFYKATYDAVSGRVTYDDGSWERARRARDGRLEVSDGADYRPVRTEWRAGRLRVWFDPWAPVAPRAVHECRGTCYFRAQKSTRAAIRVENSTEPAPTQFRGTLRVRKGWTCAFAGPVHGAGHFVRIGADR